MERDLYYRVGALLDNIEENFSYVIQHSAEYKVYLDVFSEISNFKNKINAEDESTVAVRPAARAEVDASLSALKIFVDSVNIRKNDIYRRIDKETLVVDHINDRFLLISRLIKEARSRLDTTEGGLNLVPREAPAPVRVIIANNKLELVAPKKHIGSVPDPSVDRFRIAARDILKRTIISISEAGNVDPRFLPCCEGLAFELAAPLENMSIEAVGINWQIVGEALELSKDSLPDLVIAQIRRVLTTVHVILGQYEEWRIYLTAEAGTKLSSADVAILTEQALSLVEELSHSTDVADVKISDRIRMIIDPVATGIVQSDTIGIPLIGSISNIFAALSHAAMESLPGGSSVSGRVSGGILLANFSIFLINKFTPTLSSFPPLRWMGSVHAEISKNWSTLKDVVDKR